ncbi:MAG: ATP-binding protein [Chitinophagaceae bacterium]
MKRLIQQVLRRNVYFLLTAAWLFTIAFIINKYWANFSSVRYLRSSIERYIQRQEKDFDVTVQDTGLLRKFVNDSYTKKELEDIVEKEYGIFVYETDVYGIITLKFWNNQDAAPGKEMLNLSAPNGFVHLSNGEYEYVSRQVNLGANRNLLIIGLIPVHKEYFIQTSSLKREFVNHRQAEERVSISMKATDYPVNSLYGSTLFYLQPKPPFKQVNTNWLSLTLICLGVVFLLIFIHNSSLAIAGAKNYIIGIAFLVGIIFVLRSLTYIFPSLLSLHQYSLFDRKVYSSGLVLSSLGDLLINSFLFCWIVLFVKKVTGKRSLAAYANTIWHWPLLTGVMLVFILTTFGASGIIKSLIADGRISFNVTNFFSLTIYSVIGFLVLASISFAYFFLSRALIRLVEPLVADKTYMLYLITATIGLIILTIIQYAYTVELYISTLVWLLMYVWLMQRRAISGLYSKLNISVVLFWLFIYSLSISFIIMNENQKIELEQRRKTAVKLLDQADPSRERLLSIALVYFDNDFLYSNFDRLKVASSNAYLKDSITNKNFSPYLDVFDTRLFTFDASRTPLHNEASVSYDTLNTIFQIQGKPTSVEHLRYFEKAFDKFSYIFRKEIEDTAGNTVGYFFVLSDPRRYKPDALIPELFRQSRDFFPEYSPIYSYAIYNNLELLKYYNDYQFPIHLKKEDISKQDFWQFKVNGYDELWYKDGKDKVVIFAKRDAYFLEAITLFAYIFSTFLLLVGIFSIISLLIQSRLKSNMIKQYWQLNIRSQIHGTIIFISLFSFLVIGVATIIFFINRYEKNNQERLSKAIQIMARDIQKKLVTQKLFDDSTKLYESGNNEELKKLLNEVAEIHNTEVNLYDLEGTLRIATNPFIYSEGILSTKMNPYAYYYMQNEKLVQYINKEKVGDVRYQSIYSPVINADKNAYAYLNIPSFVSPGELKREISNFLVTIIILNAFIFLVAGVIALFITNRITSSFLLIGHKMREINLGKLNEEIAWNRDDEIGGLVKEYNKMVVKLGDSALALAKSEREGAWREMARQVAHEIKNPLTPMKLSIQYLQKSINNNSENVKELSANVARTLVEQIDHLSKIAADFSQFANIGNVKNELFDLHEMLYSLTSLYESTENLEFSWLPLHQRILVMADKTQLNRLFTNLFQNAVEACIHESVCTVTISEEIREDKIIIKVTDNGSGIPEIMKSKIFTPNFTTKSSGTGLGLAMSKTIVEQAKGNIWFETVEGTGTTFFVELPVIRFTHLGPPVKYV